MQETAQGVDGQRLTARRAPPTTGLFAVPEDREVLRTPEENQNSGFVFGQGSDSVERDATPRTNEPTEDREMPSSPTTRSVTPSCETREESATVNGYLSPPPKIPSPMTSVSRGDITMPSRTGSSERESVDSISSPPARSAGMPIRTIFSDESSPKPLPSPEPPTRVSGDTTNQVQSLFSVPRLDPSYAMTLPIMQKIAQLDKEMDELKAHRERIAAAEPAPARRPKRSSLRDRARLWAPQMNRWKLEYKTERKNWLEQIREHEEKEAKRRQMWVNVAKRDRDETPEDLALLSHEEGNRRRTALHNAETMREEAVEAFNRGCVPPPIDDETLEQLLPQPFNNAGYYMEPNQADMCRMLVECGLDVLQAVRNVTFGRKGYGEVHFDGPINLEQLNFEDEIEIKHGHLLIKDLQKLSGLPATITLFQVFQPDLISDVYTKTKRAIDEICSQAGKEFISYDTNGTWVFKVASLQKE